MNVNALSPAEVRLRNEFTEAKLGTIPRDGVTIREKIDAIKIEFTKIAEFQDKELKGETERIEFDLVGVDPAISNTFRRIMIAEVPSMAIERVLIYDNSSVIQDEVLAHRLGLIPIKADPRQFEYRQESEKVDLECTDEKEAHSGKYESSEKDTLKFRLKVECKKGKNELINDVIYSSHMKWIPIGDQAEKMNAKPVYDEIVINKLRPRQGMEIELHCHKGIGKDHAKFSPVCTAFYRLLPIIKLHKEFFGKDAEELKSCFSPGVIEIENNKAVVKDVRKDAATREVFRNLKFKDHVEMGRKREHALFSVETVGALTPTEIFIESLKVLREKCNTLLKEIDDTENDDVKAET